MCGRYVLETPPATIAAVFGASPIGPGELPEAVTLARWNVGPGTEVIAVGSRDGAPTIRALRWGLVPGWAKDPAVGQRLVNARAEGIADKPSFRVAIRKRRILVPVDMYYEWAPAPAGERLKQPWCFASADGQAPMALAGLWEAWRAPGDDDWLRTCCLITTEPNAEAARVHDRMPVIIPRADWARWLDPDTPLDEVLSLLRPFPDGSLVTWPVSRKVSSVRNDGPDLVARVEPSVGSGSAGSAVPR